MAFTTKRMRELNEMDGDTEPATDDRVRIWNKVRGEWWQPNSHGFTKNIVKAGFYSREEAQDILDHTNDENEMREIKESTREHGAVNTGGYIVPGLSRRLEMEK